MLIKKNKIKQNVEKKESKFTKYIFVFVLKTQFFLLLFDGYKI